MQSVAKCWTCFFIIIIIILHGKIAVNDISAFYRPHFTFFMRFKMFLARFACHTAKRRKRRRRKKNYKKQTNKKTKKTTEKILAVK